MTQGDASFHHIKQQGNVIGLKLASSGEKFFFWLQDPADDATSIVSSLNGLLETGLWPKRSRSGDDGQGRAQPVAAPKQGMISDFARSLASIFGSKKVAPSSVLTVDNIMDACTEEDLKELQTLFPEGYGATKSDLRRLVSSPYFHQSLSTLQTIMSSEAAPGFLAQFGLLEEAGEGVVGFAALLQALLKKHQQ